MKTITLLLMIGLLTACATPEYAWKHAPEKDDAQMSTDSQKCLRASHLGAVTYYSQGVIVHDTASYYLNCMRSEGHELHQVNQ